MKLSIRAVSTSLAVATVVSLAPGAGTAATMHAIGMTTTPGSGVTDPDRTLPTNALDAPDAFDQSPINFYSLGIGGKAAFGFAMDFSGQVTINEVTWGNRSDHFESAEVYVGNLFLV